MAVTKNTKTGATNSFDKLGDLLHQQNQQVEDVQFRSTVSEGETAMPTTAAKKAREQAEAADTTTSELPAHLAQAKAENYDIDKPHPLLMDFIKNIAPKTGDIWFWAFAIAGNGPNDPMPVADFIDRSYKEPTTFIMELAGKHGDQHTKAIQRTEELEAKIVGYSNQLGKIEAENDKLRLDLANQTIAANGTFEERLEAAVTDAVAKSMVDAVAEGANIPKMTMNPYEPIKTPTKLNHAPIIEERLVVKMEADSFWETAAKAAVTGVVVGAATYGVVRALDYFFGDEE